MPSAQLPLCLLLCRNCWCLTAICCQLRGTKTCSSVCFFFPGVKRFFSIGIQFQENINTCRVKIDKMKGRRSVLNFPLTGDSRNVPWMDRPERGKHRRFLKAEWELLSALPMTTIPHFKWQNLSEIKNVHLPKFLLH